MGNYNMEDTANPLNNLHMKNKQDMEIQEWEMEPSDEKFEVENLNSEGEKIYPSKMEIPQWFEHLINESFSEENGELNNSWQRIKGDGSIQEDQKMRKFIRQKTLQSIKSVKSPKKGIKAYDFSDISDIDDPLTSIFSENSSLEDVNQELSAKEKSITLEKYRRNQAYSTLNYLLSNVTYGDFFTHDVMVQIEHAQSIAAKRKSEVVTGEHLLLGLLKSDCELKTILEEVGITQETIEKTILKLNPPTPSPEISLKENQTWIDSKVEFLKTKGKETINVSKNYLQVTVPDIFSHYWQKVDSWMEKVLDPNFEIKPQKTFLDTWIDPSKNVCRMFEMAAQYALKYKTPVISSEILFLILMENKTLKTGLVIKKILRTRSNFLSLRYKLLKRVWRNKSCILQQVKKNQHFFAYLLQVDLSGIAFDELVERNQLADAVKLYRNELILSALQIDIWPLLIQESYLALQASSNRIYSA